MPSAHGDIFWVRKKAAEGVLEGGGLAKRAHRDGDGADGCWGLLGFHQDRWGGRAGDRSKRVGWAIRLVAVTGSAASRHLNL